MGATCCQVGALNGTKRPASVDPVIPTRIDVILNREAVAVWKRIAGPRIMQRKRPVWQTDHYFYAAAITLK